MLLISLLLNFVEGSMLVGVIVLLDPFVGCIVAISLLLNFVEGSMLVGVIVLLDPVVFCILGISLLLNFSEGSILFGVNTSSAAAAIPTIPMIIARITPDAITILIRFISGFLT